MKKIFKKTLTAILIITGVFVILMLTPRFLGFLSPSKPPVGYYFVWADMLAIGTGLEKMINQYPDVPPGIEEFRNIEYKNNGGKSLRLDLYRPKNIDKPAPLLVFIHGGSWKYGKRDDYLIYLVDFALKGYVTATVSYTLLNDGPYPACIEDVCDAMKWFFENGSVYGYDTNRIALIGGSAGAHLAMLAAYGWRNTSVKPKVVVDIYGPADLTTEYSRNHKLVTDFLNSKYEISPDRFIEASPMHYTDKSDPATLIFHGSADDLVPVSQSDYLADRLDSLGVPCVFHRLPGWPHTMDIVSRVNDYFQLKMSDFFEKYLN